MSSLARDPPPTRDELGIRAHALAADFFGCRCTAKRLRPMRRLTETCIGERRAGPWYRDDETLTSKAST